MASQELLLHLCMAPCWRGQSSSPCAATRAVAFGCPAAQGVAPVPVGTPVPDPCCLPWCRSLSPAAERQQSGEMCP